MILCSFFVPGKAVGKPRARTVTHGGKTRSYTPVNGKAYEQLVATLAKKAMAGLPCTKRAVAIEVFEWRKVPKSYTKRKREDMPVPITKPDADNVLKSVCDALNGIVWIDDAQVSSTLTVRRWAAYDGIDVWVSFDMGD